ncbi:hypothetical protein MARPO_0126s0028 [Marchantia polymorpha]|uniref:Uncharacterized protein n=1 Tax=Marchantia polymorpha TaxID=3197 RepID=A0A2R6W8X7_MARPO|nr:hypothetical protein MARPO_0126s0028 [Marchantia polymorpha]|eukprot:PTQ30313.1 hypothetical protein MARPO_0126s0028 [Marchantia polymorpha]
MPTSARSRGFSNNAPQDYSVWTLSRSKTKLNHKVEAPIKESGGSLTRRISLVKFDRAALPLSSECQMVGQVERGQAFMTPGDNVSSTQSSTTGASSHNADCSAYGQIMVPRSGSPIPNGNEWLGHRPTPFRFFRTFNQCPPPLTDLPCQVLTKLHDFARPPPASIDPPSPRASAVQCSSHNALVNSFLLPLHRSSSCSAHDGHVPISPLLSSPRPRPRSHLNLTSFMCSYRRPKFLIIMPFPRNSCIFRCPATERDRQGMARKGIGNGMKEFLVADRPSIPPKRADGQR